MTEDEFWAVIAEAGRSHDLVAGLTAALGGRPVEAAVEFDSSLHVQLRRCWTKDLWQLASVVIADLDDAAFEYFRLWLVFRGRSATENVLTDPDRLADLLPAPDAGPPDPGKALCLLDGPQYVPWRVYRARTGQHMPARRRPPALLLPLGPVSVDAGHRFPRTAARLGHRRTKAG